MITSHGEMKAAGPESMRQCSRCLYWGGSEWQSLAGPCNHPAEVESRAKGYSSVARNPWDGKDCPGFTPIILQEVSKP